MDIPSGKLKIEKILEDLKNDLGKLRTGRASTEMVKDVAIEVYGSKMPIEHVATISVPDAKTIVIKPWDKGNLALIEKALISSDIGITPNVDGEIVRLSLPALTQERRTQLVKEMKERLEQAKIAIRSVRHEMMDSIDDMQKEGGVSEDFLKREKDSIESLVSDMVKEVDNIGSKKEEDLMTI